MQSNAINAFVLSRPSPQHRSFSVLTGSIRYRGSNHTGYYNECKYTRPFVYGFKTRSLAHYWRDVYASDSYQFVSETVHENNEIELVFEKKDSEKNRSSSYTQLENIYFNKVREQIEVELLDDVDDELFRRIVLCSFMAFVYVTDVHRGEHQTLVMKGVHIDPFDHITDDPLEIQQMVIDSLELNYYI